MSTEAHDIEGFLDLSVALTGFSKFELLGTGQATLFYSTSQDILGDRILTELLQAFRNARAKADSDTVPLSESIQRDVLGSEKHGPIARNIIKLWYLGTWYELPSAWRNSFGVHAKDVTFVLSPEAFTEGLLWPTLGVNPPAAKAQGYGSWAGTPYLLETQTGDPASRR